MEYLVSSELLLNIIPKHKDFPAMNSGRGESQQIYRSLRKVSDEALRLAIDSPAKWPPRVCESGAAVLTMLTEKCKPARDVESDLSRNY